MRMIGLVVRVSVGIVFGVLLLVAPQRAHAQMTPEGEVLVQVTAGLAAAGLGAYAGYRYAVATPPYCENDCSNVDYWRLELGMLGAGIAAPLAVYGTGRLLGVRGSVVVTFTGAVLGGAAGYGAYRIAREVDSGRQAGLVGVIGGLAPLAGAVIGFNLSRPRRSRSAPTAMLVAGPSTFGIAGTF